MDKLPPPLQHAEAEALRTIVYAVQDALEKALPQMKIRSKTPGFIDMVRKGVEEELIKYAFRSTACPLPNYVKASRYLNVNRNTVRKRVTEYGLRDWLDKLYKGRVQ